jgi:catechol 2,3-dioxygenase-like lactoylglutathione lyase family enzyme
MTRVTATIPILPARDIAEAVAFYGRLGFRLMGDAWPEYALVRRDGHQIHFWLCKDRALAERTACYLHSPDVDALHAELAAAGVEAAGGRIGPPEDRFWGMREFYVTDPSGCQLRFGMDVAPATK